MSFLIFWFFDLLGAFELSEVIKYFMYFTFFVLFMCLRRLRPLKRKAAKQTFPKLFRTFHLLLPLFPFSPRSLHILSPRLPRSATSASAGSSPLRGADSRARGMRRPARRAPLHQKMHQKSCPNALEVHSRAGPLQTSPPGAAEVKQLEKNRKCHLQGRR